MLHSCPNEPAWLWQNAEPWRLWALLQCIIKGTADRETGQAASGKVALQEEEHARQGWFESRVLSHGILPHH